VAFCISALPGCSPGLVITSFMGAGAWRGDDSSCLIRRTCTGKLHIRLFQFLLSHLFTSAHWLSPLFQCLTGLFFVINCHFRSALSHLYCTCNLPPPRSPTDSRRTLSSSGLHPNYGEHLCAQTQNDSALSHEKCVGHWLSLSATGSGAGSLGTRQSF
jgi:hypothetical protein